jgi:hypothetical protein
VETRFIGTAGLVSPLPEGFQAVDYPDGVVTTVIFGRQNPEDGNPVPEHGSLRFRYYSPNSIPHTHKAHVLNPRQTGSFMLKHYADPSEAIPGNQKHQLSNIALGDVCTILEHPSLLDDLAHYDGGREMIGLIREHYGEDTIMPLIVVEGVRTHLLVEGDDMGIAPARLTFDTGTTFWPVVLRKPGDVLVACRAYTFPKNILEVKKDEPLEPARFTDLLRRLFGETPDYTPQGRIKRLLGRRAVETMGTPRLINDELQLIEDPSRPSNEVLRHFQEREIKIDTDADPRDAIRAIPTRPRDGVWVDPGFRAPVVRFRFHTFSDGGDGHLVVVEKHRYVDGLLKGSHFQYKQIVAGGASDGVLVRDEVMAPSLPELWSKIGREPGELVSVTQSADRNRHQRRVVCEKTGNVFVILADYCTAESGDRAPLSQVEIEYLGTYGFDTTAASISDTDREESIAADFEHVRGVVLEALDTMVTGGQTTKEDWLTAHGETAHRSPHKD